MQSTLVLRYLHFWTAGEGVAERSTEELVLELREVGDEVQVVDSLQRQLEQVEEKLAELGGKVREGGAGARSLEAVRKEAEDVSRISLGATSYRRLSTEFSCLW